jgi:diguanylate cyclase (GGDEF)-like protein
MNSFRFGRTGIKKIGVSLVVYILALSATVAFGVHTFVNIRDVEAADVLGVMDQTVRLNIDVQNFIKVIKGNDGGATPWNTLKVSANVIRTRLHYLESSVNTRGILKTIRSSFSEHLGGLGVSLSNVLDLLDPAKLSKNGGVPGGFDTALQKLVNESDYFNGNAEMDVEILNDNQNRQHGIYAGLAFALVVVVETGLWGLFLLLLRLRQQNQLLEDLSRRDPLTGLLNRRGGMEGSQKILSMARRLNRHVAVGIADIDHFKAINDNFGHPVGDVVLEHTGYLIQKKYRDTDVVARIGGEEFMVVILIREGDDSHTLFDTIRQQIAATPIALPESSLPPIMMTVSIGVVSVAVTDETNIEDLYRRADAALYAAKEAGRNRVVIAAMDSP